MSYNGAGITAFWVGRAGFFCICFLFFFIKRRCFCLLFHSPFSSSGQPMIPRCVRKEAGRRVFLLPVGSAQAGGGGFWLVMAGPTASSEWDSPAASNSWRRSALNAAGEDVQDEKAGHPAMGVKQNTARDRWRWRMKRGHEDTQNVKRLAKYDFKNSLKYIERRGVFHLSNNQVPNCCWCPM